MKKQMDIFSDMALERNHAERIAMDALTHSEDGELYIEHSISESFSYDDGRLRSASYDKSYGFGLRALMGEASVYAHSTDMSQASLQRAATIVKSIKGGKSGTWKDDSQSTPRTLYDSENPLDGEGFSDKAKLLAEINAYARQCDNRVRQVSIALSGEWQAVSILRHSGEWVEDIRPLVRLDISIIVGEGKKQERGHSGRGGRAGYRRWLTEENWKSQADEALRQALIALDAKPAPMGEMDVVLGAGWPGILLHEAVGHGLEGDFNRKQSSVFTGKIGERIASKGVNVVDDGTLEGRRGSLNIDDEGTRTARNILIEDGILKGYMQDRQNARLMGAQPTGNGRRESYAYAPMPRMTNTYMLNGDKEQAEIIANVQDGIYAVSFGGGEVDITSGKFVFSCTEAYRIEHGKITHPIKGATLIGNGADALTKISMIANNMKLDEGIGTCGKDGQGVPVGVGQPSMLLNGLTVGGTG